MPVERSDNDGKAPTESDTASNAEHPTARSLAQLESSQTAMRDTTRWLVAAAAAVGAVVVAGLQLSKIPAGKLATGLSLGGFALALAGVAWILFSAAGVLSGGYTTIGELSDLKRDDDYTTQLRRTRKWDDRIALWEDRTELLGETPEESGGYPQRRQGGAFARAMAWTIIQTFRFAKWINVRHAENEGIRIADMLRYLDKDTLYFSNGLAKDMPELWERLEGTDSDILSLRGEQLPAHSQPRPQSGKSAPPGPIDAAKQDAAPTISRIVRRAFSPAPFRATRPRSEEKPDKVASLAELEWRQARLELAAGQLIAFANQRLMEYKFNRLKAAVRIGGLAVAVGVGSFAVAQKFSTEIPLPITQPTSVTVQVDSTNFAPGCQPGLLLQGVAVGGTWEKPIVITAAQGACKAHQVTVNSGQATVFPKISASPSSAPS